ncbi:hypothetical protein MTO96_014275 [Rhipicephalus appendiculatus]
MFTLLGKLISAALDNFFIPHEEPKYELEDDDVTADEDAADCTKNEEPKQGQITHLNPIRQYGVINEEHYFRLSLVPGEHLTVSTRVVFRLDASGRQVKEVSVLPEPSPSSIVAKVTKLENRFLHLLDTATPVQFSAGYEPDFKVRSGDWVRLHFDEKTGSARAVEALRSKDIVGQVTRLTSTGGIIDQQIAFSKDQWPTDAPRLQVGLQVAVHAIESDQGNLSWRALSLEVFDNESGINWTIEPSQPEWCHCQQRQSCP